MESGKKRRLQCHVCECELLLVEGECEHTSGGGSVNYFWWRVSVNYFWLRVGSGRSRDEELI